jgi:hypothetical protein
MPRDSHRVASCPAASLHKDAPIPRAVQTAGQMLAIPILGGLHTTNISEYEFTTGFINMMQAQARASPYG